MSKQDKVCYEGDYIYLLEEIEMEYGNKYLFYMEDNGEKIYITPIVGEERPIVVSGGKREEVAKKVLKILGEKHDKVL